MYIPTSENEADAPSCQLTSMDCKLHPDVWERVQRDFGGPQGHTCDLMALDSNAMTDQDGALLPHFTPYPSPQSCGVNIFAQDLSSGAPFLTHPYVFPPLTLVSPVLRFLKVHQRPCTFVLLDVYPKKYWWPLIQSCASKSCRLMRLKGMLELFFRPPNKDGHLIKGSPGTFGLLRYIFQENFLLTT